LITLQSSDAPTLKVPKTKYKTLSDRAFISAAPKEWSALPSKLRSLEDQNPG